MTGIGPSTLWVSASVPFSVTVTINQSISKKKQQHISLFDKLKAKCVVNQPPKYDPYDVQRRHLAWNDPSVGGLRTVTDKTVVSKGLIGTVTGHSVVSLGCEVHLR